MVEPSPITCVHGDGCPLARCRVLVLCADHVSSKIGPPPTARGALVTVVEDMYERLVQEMARRWMRWFRSPGVPPSYLDCPRCRVLPGEVVVADGRWSCRPGCGLSGGPLTHLLDDFATHSERLEASHEPCAHPRCEVGPTGARHHLLEHPSGRSWRVEFCPGPGPIEKWETLLVARDWLLPRGLEPEMWRQIHEIDRWSV